jgi:hypothetical protein
VQARTHVVPQVLLALAALIGVKPKTEPPKSPGQLPAAAAAHCRDNLDQRHIDQLRGSDPAWYSPRHEMWRSAGERIAPDKSRPS